MDCRIEWSRLTAAEWDERFARIRRPTLLQSRIYARAVCPLYGQRPRSGLILIDGAEAGLVQVQEAFALGRLVHAVILDRGPLWFEGYGTPDQVEAFFRQFQRDFKPRFGRKRRILPETVDQPALRQALAQAGLARRDDVPGYQTLWLDLTQTPELLRAGLKPQWRNKLNRAERSPLTLRWRRDTGAIPALLRQYEADRATRGYDGPSVRTMLALARNFAPEQAVLTGEALADDRVVAAVLFLTHGRGATYQIGWTTEEGRIHCAHHLLLWQAALQLREIGYVDLDLGGVNDHSASGVKEFKSGLGGDLITYAGLYR